ncbi:MAG TPA: MBL fold metallo-hydrolase [Verrucomicrobiaceae bacterium]|jgi:L-ascorbate metabolism protein UlaG (beta-lactamase superfamily)
MPPESQPTSSSQGQQGLRWKLGRNKKDKNHIGLLPTVGWRERNLRFLNDVLIPHIFTPRLPGSEASVLLTVHPEQTGVTWLGHAGFLIQIGGQNILVDPNWALWHGPVKRVRHPSVTAGGLPYIDLVLITHAHFDHLHLPSLRAIAAGQPIIVPEGVGGVVKRCAFSKITELKCWQSAHFRNIEITLTPARHWGARLIHDTFRKFGGYLIRDDRRTIFHCGDSSLFDGFTEIGKRAEIDVALMPIGAYEAPSGRPVHMNPEEALDAFEMLRARQMIPMHYGTFPLGGEPIHEPEKRLVKSTLERGFEDRVIIPPEGQPVVF